MKLLIWVGITAGGLAGGWLGSLFDHGNTFGPWTIIFSGIGSLFGIWAAVKANEYI